MPPLENLSRRTSESKRRVGKAFEINGVNAVEIDLKKSENLSDPILDLNFKLNNPVGRLWLAIKRKSKHHYFPQIYNPPYRLANRSFCYLAHLAGQGSECTYEQTRDHP